MQYLQTDDFYDWAVSPTIGATGTSECFRFKDDEGEKDIYGGLVTEWKIVFEVGKRVEQTTTFFCSQAKTTGTAPIDPAIPTWSAATPQVWNGKTLTIDNKTVADLDMRKLTMMIQNDWDFDSAYNLSSVYCVSPILIGRIIEIDIEYYTRDSNTWSADELNQTVQTVSASLGFGLFTLTLANYNVWQTNQSEEGERGRILKTAKFRIGVGGTTGK